MTLQEAKDEVANQYQYPSWDMLDFYAIDAARVTTSAPHAEERLWNEAAELYARSKWDEACEAQKAVIAELGLVALMKSNPEFKP